MPLKAIIVGAGLSGLASALALRRSGHIVLLLEKKEKRESESEEQGFGVTCGANAVRVLESSGIELERVGAEVYEGADRVSRVPGREAEVVREVVKEVGGEGGGGSGGQGWSVHRGDLWREMRNLAIGPGLGPPVKVREQATVVAFDAEAGSVTLQTGEVLKADLIVAADGVKSKGHIEVVGGEEDRPARPRGASNIRFCLPTEKFLKIRPLAGLWEERGRKAALYVGSDERYQVLMYGCRNNTLQNIGCYAHNDEDDDTISWFSSSSQVAKWRTQTTQAKALERLQGFDDCKRELVRQADPTSMYLWKIAERDSPLPTFHKSRLIMVGDAAHPMTPMLGQGAGMAIEDGGVLGIVMEGVENAAEVPERLELWNELRWKRATVVQQLSRSKMVEYDVADEAKAMIRKLLPEYQLPENITRSFAIKYAVGYDCLAEARKAVEERFGGGVDGKRVDSLTNGLINGVLVS